MQAYWAAKEQLFDWPDLQAAVFNLDDPQGRDRLTAELAGPRARCRLDLLGRRARRASPHMDLGYRQRVAWHSTLREGERAALLVQSEA